MLAQDCISDCLQQVYTLYNDRDKTQGWVGFPTGGIPRELRCRMIRCDSGGDSIVWMEELLFQLFNPEVFIGTSFIYGREGEKHV